MARSGPDPLFTFRALPLVEGVLAARGHDAAHLLRSAGLEAPAVTPVTAPLSRITSVIDATATALGDPLFGLTLADLVGTRRFGFPIFTARAAPNVRVGLQAWCDFSALVNPIGVFTLVPTRTGATLDYVVKGKSDGLGMHLNEYSLAVVVQAITQVTQKAVPIERIWLPHRRDREVTAALATRFGCPVELGAATVGLSLPTSILDEPLRTADEALYEFLWEQSRKLLELTPSDDVVSSLVRELDRRLGAESIAVDQVARALAMTECSLQRRLDERGTSFREVLDHVRHKRYRELRRANHAQEFVAEQLGFADARGLRRAIGRWEA